MPTPSINLRMSINGGSLVSGGIVVSVSDTVNLSLQSNAGITAIRFEIYSYPVGFALPAGWTADTLGTVTGIPGAYYYTGFTPPAFTINPWGKYLVRAKGNQNTTGDAIPDLTDDTSGLSALSPVNGLEDLAYLEDSRFNTEAYAAAMKANLRLMEAAFGGVGGGKLHVQTFTSSGTWQAPAGVVMAFAYMKGGDGGAGGGAGQSNSTTYISLGGAGGGAADAVLVPVFTTPLTTYNITVGAKGLGGSGGLNGAPPTIGSDGTDGTASAFDTISSAAGAKGGKGGTVALFSGPAQARTLPGTNSVNVDRFNYAIAGYGGYGGTIPEAGGRGQGHNRAGGLGGATLSGTSGGGGGGGASNYAFIGATAPDGGDTGVFNGAVNGIDGDDGTIGYGGAGGGAGGRAVSPTLGGDGGDGGDGGGAIVHVFWVA